MTTTSIFIIWSSCFQRKPMDSNWILTETIQWLHFSKVLQNAHRKLTVSHIRQRNLIVFSTLEILYFDFIVIQDGSAATLNSFKFIFYSFLDSSQEKWNDKILAGVLFSQFLLCVFFFIIYLCYSCKVIHE